MNFSRADIEKNKVLIILILLIFILWIIGSYLDGLSPVSKVKTDEFRIVDIKKGDGVWTIANKLKKKGIIKSRWVFILEALRTGLYNKIKPGEYAFYTYQNLDTILKILVKGRLLSHKITIPEGLTLWEIADILDKNGICKKEEFLKLAKDPEIAKQFGLPGPTLEGYLYPDTYYFHKYTNPVLVMKKMVDNFWKHWKKYEKIAEKKGMSLKEVITLASIVEKEAIYSREKPIIAAVYLNRLKRGMPLQADPTINYALKDFRRLYYKDYYSVKSPYNTYLNHGLPPTPICSPGEKSIRAVLFPAKVPYLYFVAKGDGTHYFSRTYREHLRAIRLVRRMRRRRYWYRYWLKHHHHHHHHHKHKKILQKKPPQSFQSS